MPYTGFCGHTLCLQCTEQIDDCPICKQTFTDEDIDPKRNYMLQDILQEYQKYKKEAVDDGFEICQESKLPEDLFCRKCETILCQKCGQTGEHKSHIKIQMNKSLLGTLNKYLKLKEEGCLQKINTAIVNLRTLTLRLQEGQKLLTLKTSQILDTIINDEETSDCKIFEQRLKDVELAQTLNDKIAAENLLDQSNYLDALEDEYITSDDCYSKALEALLNRTLNDTLSI